MKLLIGIMSCQKYKGRQDAVRSTWYKDISPDIKAFFLTGGASKDTQIKDELFLACSDTYRLCGDKLIAFLKYAVKNFEFDYILKCDDDTYVNIQEVKNIYFGGSDYFGSPIHGYHERLLQKFYADHGLRFTTEAANVIKNTGSWVNGGGGYFLSRRAVELILKDYEKYIHLNLMEDVLVATILKDHGITAKPLQSSGYKKSEIFGKFWPRKMKMITVHPVPPDDMVLIHNRKNSVHVFLKYVMPKVLKRLNMKAGG